jgi:hypothetical protein
LGFRGLGLGIQDRSFRAASLGLRVGKLLYLNLVGCQDFAPDELGGEDTRSQL